MYLFFGVGGTIYNTHSLEPFKELGPNLKELRNLLPNSVCILSSTLPNLSIPGVHFPVLLSTVIRSHSQVKPATLLTPIDLFLILLVDELYGTRYQSGSFSSINVESGFPLPA